MAMRVPGGHRAMTQQELAKVLGVTPEHVSRVLRRARDAGEPLPPRGPLPVGGREGWLLGPFVAWWERRPRNPPGRSPAVSAEELLDALAAGLDDAGIARYYGIELRAVRRAGDYWGIVIPERWVTRRRRVRQLSDLGLNAAQIIKVTGYGNGTVYRWLREERRGTGNVSAAQDDSGDGRRSPPIA
jgi:transposase